MKLLHLLPISIGLSLGRHVAAQAPGTGTCQGPGIAMCSDQFNEECDPCDGGLDCFSKLPACNEVCRHPGCTEGCRIIQGVCTPGLVSPSHVRCEGNRPLRCAEISSQPSCLLADNCIWVLGTAPEDPQGPGTCQGSGIAMCSAQFDEECDPCDGGIDCFLKRSDCNAACHHPGCTGCTTIDGICTQGLVTPSRVRCEGNKPLPCAEIASQTSCLLAGNCAWVLGPPQIETGYCEGTAITDCKTQYITDTCDPDYSLAWYDCLNYCTHPGCECKYDTNSPAWKCGTKPYTYGTFTTIWCENEPGPKECFMLNTKTLCDRAQGCTWTEGPYCATSVPGTECLGFTTPATCDEAPGCFWQYQGSEEKCDLKIEVTCKAEDGEDCEDIEPPTDTKCAKGSSLFNLYFSYQATGCGRHTNRQGEASTCEDLGVLSKSGRVGIVCVDADNVANKMEVLPDVVVPGDYFAVSLKKVGALPAKISCAIVSESSVEVFQQVTIDTSGKIDLDLKDRFGALQLEGCDDTRCVHDWTYTTVLVNTRPNDFTIDKYDLVLDVGETVDLMPYIHPKTVVGSSSEEVSIPVDVDVDVCTKGELGATAQIVITDNVSKEQCGGSSDPLQISNDVDCKLDLSIECTGAGNHAADLTGVECAAFTGVDRTQCLCGACARELRFRYTANECSTTNAQQGFVCSNLGQLPTEARVIVKQGETNIFEAESVKVGKDIVVVNGGLCLPDTLTVYVMPTGTSNSAQVFDLTTRCDSNPNRGIILLNPYGAFDFVGFSCNENSVHNCFVEVEHKICVDNGGTNPRSLTAVDLEVNGPPVLDLLQGTPVEDRTLLPQDTRCFTHMDEVELCKNQVYELAASAATSDDCPDGNYIPKSYIFTIQSAGAPPPPSGTPPAIEPELTTNPPPPPADCPTGPVSVFAPPRPAHCP